MTIATLASLLFGALIAALAVVYCFKPRMIVRQAAKGHMPILLRFPLPIEPRNGCLTVRQVRSTGLGLFLLGAWFLLVAIMSL
jgi:hypothetical protein